MPHVLFGLSITCSCVEKYCISPEINLKSVVLEEENSKVIVENENELPLRIIKSDNCLPSLKTYGTKLCDFLLIDLERNNHYYIELKGGGYKEKAYEQIETLFNRLTSQPSYSYNYRYAVVSLSYLTYNPQYTYFLSKFQSAGWKTEYIKTNGDIYNLINQTPIKIKI